MTAAAAVLFLLALAFAWSMGAHYTGACMGMPYASGSIALRPALLTMAVFTLAGAALLSHPVLATVGHHLIKASELSVVGAIAVIASAFALTTLYNHLRIPTSTIQILVFSIAGAAMALHLDVQWSTIWRLVILWAVAPIVAVGLGFVFTLMLDRITALRAGAASPALMAGRVLVAVGWLASLTMGANDVSNATGLLLTTHLSGFFGAGLLGGIGLAIGVLTWGRPLLERVAFDVVKMDLVMAAAAQLVQALVVLSAVLGFGYFTSMNQALIGAMAGTGMARGRDTVRWPTLFAILKGWLVGPVSGLAIAFAVTRLSAIWA